MVKYLSGVRVQLLRFTLFSALLVLGWPALVVAEGEGQPDVSLVEEDWMLWVYEPAGSVAAPQFITVMSPLNDLNSYYFQVTWNYWESPQFAPGGFQVQGWNGESLLTTMNIGNQELSLYAEVITWTQVLETDGNQLGFTIKDGESQTWGQFGYPETFIATNGAVSNLNNYSPSLSAAKTVITYGKNRVIYLTLKEVRYYGWVDGDLQLIDQDRTERSVYQIFDGQ